MDWLRSKVSGHRNRYKDDEYNLDITYITDRILAMSFPASGFEQCYRNNISRVSQFLDEKHPGSYKIYNLSNRSYNTNKFKGEVVSYEWEDHHSPPLLMLFKICKDMYDYLKDPANVVVVHCNAGKGRTGTSIACFLMYSGLSKNSQDAIRYYGRKRFSTGLGITQPSQIRYVRYFELVYKGIICSPSMLVLKEIKMHTVPHFSGRTCRPFLELISIKNFEVIYTGKNSNMLRSYKDMSGKNKDIELSQNDEPLKSLATTRGVRTKVSPGNRIVSNGVDHKLQKGYTMRTVDEYKKDLQMSAMPKVYRNLLEEEKMDPLSNPDIIDSNLNDETIITIPQARDQLLIGDVLIRIKHKGSFSNSLICRICINTAFTFNEVMTYTIKDIDPVSIRKDDRYTDKFALTLTTEPFCRKCNSLTPISQF